MFLRPAVLSRGHVALVVSPVLSYPSGSNKAITAAATMETEIMISTMGSVHDHWMTCKSRVDEMMRQFEDFDFSICSPQENLVSKPFFFSLLYCANM